MTQLSIAFLDLNGTLVDDWDANYAAVKACFAHHQVACPSQGTFIKEVALTGDYYNFYVSRGIRATRDELHQIFLPAYWEHRKEAIVVDGGCAFVEHLKTSGVEVHILTAARKDFAEALLRMTGVMDMCDAFHYHVHDKSAQLHAVIGTTIDPAECLIIGDLPSDIRAGQSVGAHSALITNKHTPQELIKAARECGCQMHALSFTELLPQLKCAFRNL